jgi:hypothetical protein
VFAVSSFIASVHGFIKDSIIRRWIVVYVRRNVRLLSMRTYQHPNLFQLSKLLLIFSIHHMNRVNAELSLSAIAPVQAGYIAAATSTMYQVISMQHSSNDIVCEVLSSGRMYCFIGLFGT